MFKSEEADAHLISASFQNEKILSPIEGDEVTIDLLPPLAKVIALLWL